MRGIIGLSLRFQFLVITIAVVIMAFGITQLSDMPVDILPEFSVPYVEIQTEALGLSAKEMEQMITVPMEQDLLAGAAALDDVLRELLQHRAIDAAVGRGDDIGAELDDDALSLTQRLSGGEVHANNLSPSL